MSNNSGIALRRSSEDAVLAGILGGVAAVFQLNSFRLRLTFAIVSFLSGVIPGLVTYLVLLFLIPPTEPETSDIAG